MTKQVAGAARVRPMLPRTAKAAGGRYDKNVGKLKEGHHLKPAEGGKTVSKKKLRVGPKADRAAYAAAMAEAEREAAGQDEHKVSKGKKHRGTAQDLMDVAE